LPILDLFGSVSVISYLIKDSLQRWRLLKLNMEYLEAIVVRCVEKALLPIANRLLVNSVYLVLYDLGTWVFISSNNLWSLEL